MYATLPELIRAYRDGRVTGPLVISDGAVTLLHGDGVTAPARVAFSMPPGAMLRAALDLLQLPHEDAPDQG